MKLYFLFVLMAAVTILSPGPGVITTLTNSLHHGWRGTLAGILGLALGNVVVAVISATSIGLILATSVHAFTIIKFIGAAYLIYLGIRLWRAPSLKFNEQGTREVNPGKRFGEGLSLQLTNPKAVFFFLSVFPQFIDPTNSYAAQFSALVLIFSVLFVAIHCLYAFFALKAKTWLTSERGGRLVNKIGGAVLVSFGLVLATSKR